HRRGNALPRSLLAELVRHGDDQGLGHATASLDVALNETTKRHVSGFNQGPRTGAPPPDRAPGRARKESPAGAGLVDSEPDRDLVEVTRVGSTVLKTRRRLEFIALVAEPPGA